MIGKMGMSYGCFFVVENNNKKVHIILPFHVSLTGPRQAPGLFSQYPVRREGIRPNATTMLIGSKKNVPSSTKEKMLHEKCHVLVDVKYI